jgi:ubiquinone/menaquinone biosynthesis C-methylase UbiE
MLAMPDKQTLKKWRATQEHWDDDEFLGVTANLFMKLRWRRLNVKVAAALGQARRGQAGLDLVDLGCAHADFHAYAAKYLKSYTGIEPSKALLPKNIKRGQNFRLLRGTAEKIPLPANSADFVLVKEVLDHCFDPLKVVKEARRVLRPGGALLITLTNDAAWYKRLFPGWAKRIKAGQLDHLYFFKPGEVSGLLKQAGFEGIQQEDSHYLRLPYKIESLLGRLPESLASALISLTDAAGELLLPGAGGSFWVRGVK